MRNWSVFVCGALIGIGTQILVVPGFDAHAAEPQRAAKPMFKGVELYSWRASADGTWHFALLPGTNRNKSADEVLAARGRIETIAALKAHFKMLARGEEVFWLAPDDPRFALPPRATLVELNAAAEAAGIRLVLPHRAAPEHGVPKAQMADDAIAKIVCTAEPGDNKPETGVPRAALRQRAVRFEDRGPVRHVLDPAAIVKIVIRHHDDAVADVQTACATLRTVLRSDTGSTVAHLPWSEALPAPSLDTVVIYGHGGTAQWLLWPSRSVIRDSQGRWWFAHGF